jgi:hypothetical protein
MSNLVGVLSAPSAGEFPIPKKNNKKNDFLKRRVRRRIGKKAKTVDEFLTGEKRRNLAKEIQERARKYKLVSMHVCSFHNIV